MLADISSVDAIYIVCGRTDMRTTFWGQALLNVYKIINLDIRTIELCIKCVNIKNA